MPAWLNIVGAALAGLGAITGIIGGNKASKAAKKQAREEARLEGIVTAEKVRQLEKQEVITRGETIAGYAGSGVKVGKNITSEGLRGMSGSPLMVLAEQAREFARERQVTQEAGASRAAQALGSGKAIADQYKYGGYSQAASGFAQMFRLLGP